MKRSRRSDPHIRTGRWADSSADRLVTLDEVYSYAMGYFDMGQSIEELAREHKRSYAHVYTCLYMVVAGRTDWYVKLKLRGERRKKNKLSWPQEVEGEVEECPKHQTIDELLLSESEKKEEKEILSV